MLSLSSKKNWLLIGFTLLALGLATYSYIEHNLVILRTDFANEQIAFFDDMQSRASESSDQALNALQAIMQYYPSGTKQVKNSNLDNSVEAARHIAFTSVIRQLRATTGKDFGDDPNAWLDNLKPGWNDRR